MHLLKQVDSGPEMSKAIRLIENIEISSQPELLLREQFLIMDNISSGVVGFRKRLLEDLWEEISSVELLGTTQAATEVKYSLNSLAISEGLENTFFEHIRMNFGVPATNSLKNYIKQSKIVDRLKCKKNYLVKCRKNKIYPIFINDSCRRFNHLYNESSIHSVSNFINGIKRKYLNTCIEGTFRKLKHENKKLLKTKHDVFQIIPEQIAKEYFVRQKITSNKFKDTESFRLSCKFDALLNKYSLNGYDYWFMNLSNIEIPNSAKKILGMGPKYNLPYVKKELPIKNVISEVENLIRNIPDDQLDEKDEMRRQITRSITSFKLRENVYKSP